MLASIENMQANYRDGVFAYSPVTGEEYSANPGDYWNAKPGWIMRDANGQPMELATRETRILPLTPTLET